MVVLRNKKTNFCNVVFTRGLSEHCLKQLQNDFMGHTMSCADKLLIIEIKL